MKNGVESVFRFYLEGFRSMTLGKTLWVLIILKIFILFFVLRFFFFPDFLKTKFHTEQERGEYVIEQLTQ
ncbi:MAG: DUF4492 domain-containing protein [Bacteroidales bacterium]|nr:DUF4492 domain-containing protein [Bacteroidales bacterium]